jgi:hypothetical protein
MHCQTVVIGPKYRRKTIQLPTIIATIYNVAVQPVDDMQQPVLISSNTVLEPGQEKQFQLYNIIVRQKPVFFRLTFYSLHFHDWGDVHQLPR